MGPGVENSSGWSSLIQVVESVDTCKSRVWVRTRVQYPLVHTKARTEEANYARKGLSTRQHVWEIWVYELGISPGAGTWGIPLVGHSSSW